MNCIYISILSLFLLSCSGDQDYEAQIQKPIDWEEELFGVGMYGTHPDSLNDVWYYYPVSKASISYIIGRKRPIRWVLIKGDTLFAQNRFAHNTIKNIQYYEKMRNIYIDSSAFLISYSKGNLIQLTKIRGDSIIPKTYFVQPSSKKLDNQFQYLTIRMHVLTGTLNLKMTSYRDTSYAVADCYKCKDRFKHGKFKVLPKDQRFINSFINTLIPLKDKGEKTGIVCTYGYSMYMELIYDSLSYKYDNLSYVPIKSDIVNEYFSFAVDTSQFTLVSKDFDGREYLDKDYRERGFKNFENGNDIVEPMKGPPELDVPFPEISEEKNVEIEMTVDTLLREN